MGLTSILFSGLYLVHFFAPGYWILRGLRCHHHRFFLSLSLSYALHHAGLAICHVLNGPPMLFTLWSAATLLASRWSSRAPRSAASWRAARSTPRSACAPNQPLPLRFWRPDRGGKRVTVVVGVQEMRPETVSEDKDAEYKLVCTHTAHNLFALFFSCCSLAV